jgi:hypothetical protein
MIARVEKRRPLLPQDKSLPQLLVWEAWESPRGKHVFQDYYWRAVEALEDIGLWLYAEADSEGNLTGRVAVQAKD